MSSLPETQKEETLSFEQIEIIILDRLPPSAKKYSAWWNNEVEGSHVQARGWMGAGWQKDIVNFDEKWVRFVRR